MRRANRFLQPLRYLLWSVHRVDDVLLNLFARERIDVELLTPCVLQELVISHGFVKCTAKNGDSVFRDARWRNDRPTHCDGGRKHFESSPILLVSGKLSQKRDIR